MLLKKLFHHLLLVLGCIHLVGGPYALIQCVAWANMLVSYSQDSSLSKAVTDTFSGEKPCSLCKKIASAKNSETGGENDRAPLAPATKPFPDLFPPSSIALKDPLSSPLPCPAFASPGEMASPAASAPPTPPPRC